MKLFSAPDIEKRKGEEILNEVKGIVPFYVPEWNLAEDKGSGPALVRIFSMIMDNIIQRLNRVPDKNFIAFLSMLGVNLNPPQPARVPVTFLLSAGAKENVLIPERTKTAAGDIIFETEKDFVATPYKISKAFSVDNAKGKDEIYEVPSNIIAGVPSKEKIAGTTLFQGNNKQKHILYLGHKDLFNIKNSGTEIILAVKEICALKKNVTWKLYGEENFNNNKGSNITIDTTKEPITLTVNGEIKEHELDNINSRWISVSCKSISQFINKEVSITLKKVKKENSVPEMLFYNDVPLDLDLNSDIFKHPFYPFGKVPRLFDTFYIAHNDVFSKKNAKITLLINTEPSAIDLLPVGKVFGIGSDYAAQLSNNKINNIGELLKKKPEELRKILTKTIKDKKGEAIEKQISQKEAVNILEAARKDFHDKTETLKTAAKTTGTNNDGDPLLSWEFWNGKGWKTIKGVNDTTNKLRGGTVSFICPNDIEPAVINGHKNYWIRVRIIGGDYGKEIEIVGNGVQKGTVTPPKIYNLLIGYFNENSQALEHIKTYNNLDYKNIPEEGKASDKPFKPFEPLDDEHKTLYLGFDNKLEKGPVSIFFDIEEVEMRDEWVRIEWQYCIITAGKITWNRLEVLDETDAFAKSGTVEFVLPDNFSKCRRFGEELYWIRAAVDTEDGLKLNNPLVKGIYINTAWTIHAETIKDELLGSSNGGAKQSFFFSRFPVISSDVWVNEISGLSDGERKKITEEKTINSIENKDEKGNTTEFWIQWTSVDDLLSYSENDRYYEVDKSSGVIRFGDGKHGRIPPAGKNNIKADYRTGGGTKGNVDSSAINTLKTSIAFVDKVFNPIPSGGGG